MGGRAEEGRKGRRAQKRPGDLHCKGSSLCELRSSPSAAAPPPPRTLQFFLFGDLQELGGEGSAAQVLRVQIPIPISGPAQSRSQYPIPIVKPSASWTFKLNFISFQYQVPAQSRSQCPISGPYPIHSPI